MIIKIEATMTCDGCGKECKATIPLDVGNHNPDYYKFKYPYATQGVFEDSIDGSYFYCASCYKEHKRQRAEKPVDDDHHM